MASSPDAWTLAGRLAVVTGASSGIGFETAARLRAAGAEVVMVARTADRLEEAAARIGGVACSADVSTEDGVRRVGRLVAARARNPAPTGADAAGAGSKAEGAVADIVVHAAGAFELAPLVETSVASFDTMLAVNLRAAFLLVRAFVPGMLSRGSGHIVTIGSVAGRQAFQENGAYSASKFGVRGLHAVLAAELRGTGVRATFVEPAATDTALWDGIEPERSAGLPPRSAMLAPAAVADAVLYAVTRPPAVGIPNILLERT